MRPKRPRKHRKETIHSPKGLQGPAKENIPLSLPIEIQKLIGGIGPSPKLWSADIQASLAKMGVLPSGPIEYQSLLAKCGLSQTLHAAHPRGMRGAMEIPKPLQADCLRLVGSMGLLHSARYGLAQLQSHFPQLSSHAIRETQGTMGALSWALKNIPSGLLSGSTQMLSTQLINRDIPKVNGILSQLKEMGCHSQQPVEIKPHAPQVDPMHIQEPEILLLGKLFERIEKRMEKLENLLRIEGEKRVIANESKSDTAHPARGRRRRPRYALQKGLGSWELTFDGKTAILRHEKGIFYVSYLLKNPTREPIHALDLAERIPEIYGKQRGITELVNPKTGKAVPLVKHARIQERNHRLDDLREIRKLQRKQKIQESVLDDPNASEPEKNEALQKLQEISECKMEYAQQSKSNAAALVRSVRKAITRFQERMSRAVDEAGNPHPVLRPFADHIEKYLLIPSSRFLGNIRATIRGGFAGCFTYEPPSGVKWSD